MRWQQTEFVLKGIYLGLLLFVALQVENWYEIGLVAALTLGGFAVFFAIAAVRKLREGYRVHGRKLAFLMFLLLENPGLIYAGTLIGLLASAVFLRQYDVGAQWAIVERGGDDHSARLLACALGGAVLGVVFWILRRVREQRLRLYLCLGLAAVLVGGAIALLQIQPNLFDAGKKEMIGALLLLGIPLFYVLTFASLVEESEIEVAAMCAALDVGLWMLGWDRMSDTFRVFTLLIPLVLCFFYVRHILPGLRIHKHVLRGLSYASVGRYRWALISLRRAVELDPNNKWAREALWSVHRQMDFEQIANDPQTLELVDFEMCLERVAMLLNSPPTDAQLHEATRLLGFVTSQRPDMLPRCEYWRAVACTHRRNYDEAVEHLRPVLAGTDSQQPNPQRQTVLFPAWQFALTHPEMARRVGHGELQVPGRRMEAITAVERQLRQDAADAGAIELNRFLYQDLKEGEYNEAVPPGKAAEYFDHGYCLELGAALIKDPAQWERGAEYLRLAARGLPQYCPSIHVQIARASEKAGNYKGAWAAYEEAKAAGKSAGPGNLSPEDRKIYFQVVRMLADAKMEDGDVEAALENYRLYTEYDGVDWKTYRNLAELYERKGDPWSALHATEHALTYNATDRDLLERKDRYYYSITPDQVRERLESVYKWLDANYCLQKAKTLLDRHAGDLDLLDWAAHLVELARVVRPGSFSVKLLAARLHRLRGENDAAVQLLEEIRAGKPEKFPSDEEEEAWFFANKMLGDLYLHEKPDAAVECLLAYRNSPKSGADTMYKLGVAFEKLGDTARAAKCYEQVTAYEHHPLHAAAVEALRRLRGAA